MKRWLAVFGGALLAVFLFRPRPGLTMHELDRPGLEGEGGPRTFRSPAHALHHLRELVGCLHAITGVYAMRRLDPALREQVMLVTALANRCPP